MTEKLTNKIGRLGSQGAALIIQERWRQIEEEGWTAEHDDLHTDQQLAYAAAAYGLPQGERRRLDLFGAAGWSMAHWKPTPDRIRELTKAGALIAAEIDRLLRLKDQTKN